MRGTLFEMIGMRLVGDLLAVGVANDSDIPQTPHYRVPESQLPWPL